jgi:hypothetical protein
MVEGKAPFIYWSSFLFLPFSLPGSAPKVEQKVPAIQAETPELPG